jgi:hypothetical protein
MASYLLDIGGDIWAIKGQDDAVLIMMHFTGSLGTVCGLVEVLAGRGRECDVRDFSRELH